MVACLKDVDWHELGIQLKVPNEKLREIDKEYQDVPRKLNEVLAYWLNNGEELSWESVLKALERIGGHTNLVSDLRMRHCTSVTSSIQMGPSKPHHFHVHGYSRYHLGYPPPHGLEEVFKRQLLCSPLA